MVAIWNCGKTLKKITYTSPYRGECDRLDCMSFCDLKKIKIDPWQPFLISTKPLQNNLHISIFCECDCKIWIISDIKFKFLRPFWILVASFKIHLHIHMLLGIDVKIKKKIDQTWVFEFQ